MQTGRQTDGLTDRPDRQTETLAGTHWTDEKTAHRCPEFRHALLLDASSVMQVALQYTEAQEQDLLHLRRLFYGKLGQLARERALLLSKMPAACNVVENNEPISFHLGFRHVADQLTLTKEVSDQLCANHAEESSVYMSHGFCLFRCVSCLRPRDPRQSYSASRPTAQVEHATVLYSDVYVCTLAM